ncbi:MAG TPA: DHA2 family efflux MFS transporter permease subunit [Thermomicrobiales bacterium]|nr:DHA2 family efflux MFS transporter permease subunit [Thermomicrobiales bacterium]
MPVHDDRAPVNPWLVLAVLCLGLFMTLLDLTIVNIAIPSIIDGLSATLDQILWVLNAYSLVYAVLLITSGRLGDLLGPRNLFGGGLAVFTVASALSGLAHDPTQLILARAAQGLGAALMSPQSLPIITSLFPPERRGAAFGATGALGGLAVVAGPTLGGLIVTHWGWRWIFYVNLPVGILTLALALLIIPDLRPGRQHRLDLPGVALATTGLFGVVFGLIEGQRYDWGTVWSFISIPMIIGVGVVLLVAFLASQALRQDGEPLLPFAIFHDRNYALMTVVLAAIGFAMLGLFLPLTIYFQSVLGLSALAAGLTIAPQAVAMMFVAPVSGALADRFGGKVVLIPGLTLFAVGMADIAWIAQANSGRWSFLPALILSGVGLGCVWAPVYSIAMRDIEPHLAGVASGVISTVQEVGGVLASAIVGALLQNRLAIALHDRAAVDAAQLPAQFRDSFVSGFSNAAKGGLEVGAGQTGGSLALPPGVPANVTQQLQQLAHDVFTHAFVTAMRPTLVLPIVVVLLAALTCFAIQRRRATATVPAVEEAVTA